MIGQGWVLFFGLCNGLLVNSASPLHHHGLAKVPQFFNDHHLRLVGIAATGDFLLKALHDLAESLSHRGIGTQLLQELGFLYRRLKG